MERLLEGYRRYLFDERGLTGHTVFGRYEPTAQLLLSGRLGPGGFGLERLSADDVSLFLVAECPKRSISGAREPVWGLRSLLRYLHLEGLILALLQWAVPGVADLRDRTLPRGLEPAVVAKLLSSCDRRRTVGVITRHTAATEMLKAGASLPEIGEVLRHREQKTTAMYAKVDRKALRALARPWPEGVA